MSIEELLCLGNQSLHKDTNKLLLGTLLNINPLELNLHLKDIVDKELVDRYLECLKRLEKGEPIQYALKNVNFYGFDFYVDERVLIPRFETEELVFNVNNFINKYFANQACLLDLCTGSGCIGLTLKKINSNLEVALSDVSKKALEVAKINADNLNVNVKIITSNLFTNVNTKFDVIVSNPPYVSKTDEIEEIVLKNEPNLALFANEDGLEYYRKILKDCENYLNSKYLIAFEIGNSQKDKVIELIHEYLNDVKIISKRDLSGRDRMIFIFKNVDILEEDCE